MYIEPLIDEYDVHWAFSCKHVLKKSITADFNIANTEQLSNYKINPTIKLN